MTVNELIENLEKFDGSSDVLLWDGQVGYMEVVLIESETYLDSTLGVVIEGKSGV